jgi:Integral membrane protein S linking to the trans Golgi network
MDNRDLLDSRVRGGVSVYTLYLYVLVLFLSISNLFFVNSIYYLYTLVRRPRLVLDFALTLVFNHLVLTTYYSASVPSSLFFWIILAAGTAGTVIITEQLCVKREMTEGLAVPSADATDDVEMGDSLRRD